MNKIIPLSLLTLSILTAQETQLESIQVESTLVTEVAKKAQKSADLAEALSTQVPSIDMNRRSGIANDIIIRGQKRDNISIEVDGTKVYGACPNRMDPPVSHILASQIEDIEVFEGPYDVETFGTMSGGVKITTKKPSTETKGELNVGLGAWGYNKIGASISGGNDFARALVSVSRENAGQYKDGNGDTLSEQVVNNGAMTPNQFQPKYQGMDAYTKKSLMTKLFINPFENQELRLGYTANRSDNILYPNSKMDAIFDDSDIYNLEYEFKDISNTYKSATLQYYSSKVTHPMSTEYRNAAIGVGTMGGMVMSMTSQLESTMEGLKFKNNLDLSDYKLSIGLDTSERTWDGFYQNNISGMIMPTASIDNAVTKNSAIFTKVEKSFSDLNIKIGLRYDKTNISTDDLTTIENDYDALNGNIFATYDINKDNNIFIGVGKSSRVPDGRELYFTSSKGMLIGNPNLDQTTNKQIDLGYKLQSNNIDFKVKTFYSMLSNYIYYNSTTFENIDAIIYGAELTASYYATNEISIDGSLSYKVGEKDEALAGQNDTDLADIAPLRGSLALNYEYAPERLLKLNILASDRWNDFDSDNGEQELAGWAIANLSVKHSLDRKLDFVLGINNIFDATYAVSNTYSDITLVATGAGDTIVLNEPGRYIYTNMNFRF